jgi:hypothetical protein
MSIAVYNALNIEKIMSFSLTRRLLWAENPAADNRTTTRIWNTLSGSSGGNSPFIRYKAIPRHLNGYFDGMAPRTSAQLRWYPYKQELTVSNQRAMTVDDMLSLYLPPMLNDDERVKYTSLKLNRSEQEVAMQIFEMRRLKQIVAQTVRNKVKAKSWRLVDGQSLTEQERRFQLQAIVESTALETCFLQGHSFEPFVVYSPHYEVGGCIDLLGECPRKIACRYYITEVRVDKSISTGIFPDCIGMPKFPLHNFEPSIFNIIMLKLSVLAVICKQEHYVNDNHLDIGHDYQGIIFHVTEDLTNRRKMKSGILNEACNMDLARTLLEHHYEHHVVPLKSLRTN